MSKCDNISQNLLVFSEEKCVLSFTPLKLLLILNVSTGITSGPGDAGKTEQGKTCLGGMKWRKKGSVNDKGTHSGLKVIREGMGGERENPLRINRRNSF